MYYDVTVPPTIEQGSYKMRVSDVYQSKAADALQDYNSARDHDGQAPLARMPKGTIYKPLYVWEIQQYTGSPYGWECVYQQNTRKDALQTVKEYRENQPEYPARIRRRGLFRGEAYPNSPQ